MKRNFGGQPSLGAMPRSYQVTPKVLGRRRATKGIQARPTGRRDTLESARRQPENKPQRPDVSAQTFGDSDSDNTLERPNADLSRTGFHGDWVCRFSVSVIERLV